MFIKKMKYLLIFFMFISTTYSSGIPMWEFLSRGEKVGRLFHVFMRQVDTYCNTSDMPDCNKSMMVHGLSSLARMEDDHLDAMDPHQRDANELIWNAMMHDHDKPSSQSSSASDTSNGSNQLPSVGGGNLKESSSNLDIIYTRGPSKDSDEHSHHILSGPMEVKVLPDGRPIPGDKGIDRSKMEDPDMVEYRMMNTKPHHHPSVNINYRSPRQLKFTLFK